MTTARAKLHAELVDALKAKGKAAQFEAVLDRYRVQFKSSQIANAAKTTARELLKDALLIMARKPPKDVIGQVAALLDDYRMQAKGNATKAPAKKRSPAGRKPAQREQAAAATPATTAARTPAAKGAASSAPVRSTKPPPAKPPTRAQAKASREQAKRSTRAECPKCHSMGVVLARSYASDEYYSCIYCGWQGYKSPEALEAEDSLAARLLGIYASGDLEVDDDLA